MFDCMPRKMSFKKHCYLVLLAKLESGSQSWFGLIWKEQKKIVVPKGLKKQD